MVKSTLLAANPAIKVSKNSVLQSLTYIPDNNFESALIQFGYDNELDNYVETNRISKVQSLKLNDRQIRDATGIEAFVSLIDLSVTNNLLDEIDVSQNKLLEIIEINDNNLKGIDVSKNLNLKLLSLYNNDINEVDVSLNSNLETLILYSNPLSTIDLKLNTEIIKSRKYIN